MTFGGAFPESMMSIDPKLAATLRNGSRLSATNMPVSGALVREVNVLAICDPFSAEQTVMGGGVSISANFAKLDLPCCNYYPWARTVI